MTGTHQEIDPGSAYSSSDSRSQSGLLDSRLSDEEGNMAALSVRIAQAIRDRFSTERIIPSFHKLSRRALRASLLVIVGLTLSAGRLFGAGPSTPRTVAGRALPSAQQISIIDFSQCRNDAAPSTNLGYSQCINGIHTPQHAHYAEDQSTRQRAEWLAPDGGVGTPLTDRTFNFAPEARHNGIH